MKKNIFKKYNSIVIGFGKAGKTLAFDLSKNYQEKVALIEKSDKMYGGTCINIGCIPTKRLVHESLISTKTNEYYQKSIKDKDIFIKALRQKNYDKVANSGVDIIDAKGYFVSEKEIEIIYENGKKEVLKADKFFINTGAKTVIPKIEGINNKFVYDSTQLQNLKNLPKNLIIIGAGYVGCEFASMYSDFGSKVTLIETSDYFLPREEEIIVEAIKKHFENKKINLITSAKVTRINSLKNGASIEIKIKNKRRILKADAILYSTGRKPNIEELKIENANIKLNEKGNIITNKYLQTTQPNIYAMGDVVGGLQFTYISLDDYRIVKSHLFNKGKYNLESRTNIPYSVFINPPFARIGLTEKEAVAKGYKIKTNTILASQIIKANILKNTNGVLKAIVDKDTDLILGVHLLVEESFEIINIIKMAMDNKIKYTYIKNQIFTHPTISEALNDLFDM